MSFLYKARDVGAIFEGANFGFPRCFLPLCHDLKDAPEQLAGRKNPKHWGPF